MPIQSGTNVLLKIGDGGSPTEIFTTIGGLRLTSFSQRNPTVDVTTRDSNGWQELLEGAGTSSVSVTGSGRFSDTASADLLASCAFNKSLRNYQIFSGNGDVLAGKFLITSYQRTGNYGAEEIFTLSMTSSGAVTYTPA